MGGLLGKRGIVHVVADHFPVLWHVRITGTGEHAPIAKVIMTRPCPTVGQGRARRPVFRTIRQLTETVRVRVHVRPAEWKGIKITGIADLGHADPFEITDAGGAAGGIPGGAERWQQQGRQNCDDRDHDQKFNEGKASTQPEITSPAARREAKPLIPA